MKTALVPAILLAAVVSAADGETLVERINLTFSVEQGDTVRLSSSQGSVKVTQAPGRELRVEAVKRVEAAEKDARELLDQIDVAATQEPGAVVLTTVPPRKSVERGGTWSWKGPSWSVDYHLEVPAMCSVDLSLTSGDVDVDTYSGSVVVTCTSGDIEVAEVRGGPVSLRTTSGDVEASSIDTDLSVTATSGDVTLDGIVGTVSLEVVSGDVSTRRLDDDVRVSSVSGDVLLDLGTVECPDVAVDCVSGDVSITLSKEVSATFSITTASGEVSCGGLPIRATDARESNWQGTAGDGCGTIEIQTVGGDVSVGH